MKRAWWKECVVYQIYPRSFNDTSGNGVGDIRGIIEKLDYIKSLGADAIWLCPVYESPNDDNGYDISNYRKIMPEFGTQEDFDELLETMHTKGLKLIMDLVANHSSDEHAWFEESRKSKDNPYRDYYFWRPGENGGPPNNWKSFFGGSAWEHDAETDEYFLHLFTKKQPDLNWENPKVREEIHDVVDYWFQKGVDGFRMDVISVISKPPGLPDSDTDIFDETINRYYANGPKIHDYLKEMNEKVLSKYDIMTVGEGPGIDLTNGINYVHEDRNELNMVFHFGHMFIHNGPGGKYDPIEVDLPTFKKVFNDWDDHLKDGGWGSIFLGNHDFSRMISRFGNDKEYREASAKLLATLLFTLRGTVYVYQGDEIGMTNVAYPSIEDYDDVETHGAWKDAIKAGKDMEEFMSVVHDQSRDNARTPIQWSGSENAGFTDAKPWIKINENYTQINVEDQEKDSASILNFYREIIAFRKENLVFVYGDYESLDDDNTEIYAYRRWDESEEYLLVHNFSDTETDWNYGLDSSDYELVKSNLLSDDNSFTFSPWESKVFRKTT
jgi:oligo-1,6-glucosidase